ncbi:MAG: hypothetical protein ACK4N4_05660 [Burkholderiales bacterium]
MTQDETACERGGVPAFERLGKDAAVSGWIFGLAGKPPFFAESSHEDVAYLTGCTERYAASGRQKRSSAKAKTATSCCC